MSCRLVPTILVLFAFASILGAPPAPAAPDDPLPSGAVTRIGSTRLRHGRPVSSVAFLADGKRLASTDGESVAIWDLDTGRALAFRFLPWQYRAWDQVLSHDGTLIACRLENGALGVLETETGKERCVLPSREGEVHHMAFSRDKRWLASADREGAVSLWDLSAGKLSRQWKPPARDFLDRGLLAFTPDSKTVAHAQAGHIHLWDVVTGKERAHFEPEKAESFLSGFAVSPDGQSVAIRQPWGHLHIWDIKAGRFVRDIEAQPNEFGPVFAPDGKAVLCGEKHGGVAFWDVASAKLARRLKGEAAGDVTSLAFSPDGKQLAAGGHDHVIHVWDLTTGKELLPPSSPGGIMSASLLSDGKTLLTHTSDSANRYRGLIDGRLGFWDLKGRSLKSATFDAKKAHVFAVAPDGKAIVLAKGPHFGSLFRPQPNKYLWSSIRLCDLETGKELVKLEQLPCQITDLAFSPDGKFLFLHAFNAGPNPDGYDRVDVVQVWKRTGPGTLEKVTDLPTRDFTQRCVTDNRWVAVPTKTGTDFHDCETGRRIRSWKGVPGAARAASPSGRLIVCAVDDEPSVCVVEQATGKRVCKLDCKPRYLVRPRFVVSPDGRIVAGDLHSATIVLWDALTGKELGKLVGHRGEIRSLAFTPDGRHLVSGSEDTTVLVWDYRSVLPKPVAPARHTPEQLAQLWADLQKEDAESGYAAVSALVAAPEQAVDLLRQKLPLTTADDQRRIQRTIQALGDDNFKVRTDAQGELTRSAELADAALREALRGALPLESRRRIESILARDPGTPPAVWRTTLRALDLLEMIGTPEARRLLETLCKAGKESPHQAEAQRSLERLSRRP